MTAAQKNNNFPCSWSRTAKLRQEKIAKRLAENGSRANEIDLKAIKARRARLRALTRNMKRPLAETEHSSAPGSAYSKAKVRLAPIGSRSPNQLDMKMSEDSLLQKRKLPSMFPRDSDENKASSINYSDRSGTDSDELLKKQLQIQDKIKNSKEPMKETEEVLRRLLTRLNGAESEDCLGGIAELKERLVEAPESDRLVDSYVEAGLLPPLVDCLTRGEPNVQLEAGHVLRRLFSKHSEILDAVLEAGVTPKLVGLLSSADERLVLYAIETLGNLAEESLFVCQSVVDEGIIKPLLELALRSQSLECLRALSRTFRILTEHKSLSPSYEDMVGLIEAAKLFINHRDKEIYLNGCWSFAGITDSDRNKIDIVLKADIIPYIIEKFLKSEEDEKITPSIKIVGNIMAETDDQTESVVSAGVVPVLVKHLNHKSMKIRKECAWALSNIMCGTCSQIQAVIDSNALPRLAASINEDEGPVKREAIWCVSNMLEIGSSDQIREAVNSDLLRTFARNISKYTYTTELFDKTMLYHLLNGVRNMIKFCSDEIALGIVLQEISIKEIQQLTESDDGDISEQAKFLHYFIAFDENSEEEYRQNAEEQSDDEQWKNEQEQQSENKEDMFELEELVERLTPDHEQYDEQTNLEVEKEIPIESNTHELKIQKVEEIKFQAPDSEKQREEIAKSTSISTKDHETGEDEEMKESEDQIGDNINVHG